MAYGQWHGEVLSDENRKLMLIPHGFAHGFLVLSKKAIVCYKCDNYYHPDDEIDLAWNDPNIGIIWPRVEGRYNGSASSDGYSIDGIPLMLSEKDQRWPKLSFKL